MRQRIVMSVMMVVMLAAMAVIVIMPPQVAESAPLMARTVLTPTQIAKTGTAVTLRDATVDGDKFINNGQTWFVLANAAGETITATFVTTVTYEGLAVADLVVAVADATTKYIGPFSTVAFNQGGTGTDADYVYVDYTYVTTLTGATVGAFRFE